MVVKIIEEGYNDKYIISDGHALWKAHIPDCPYSIGDIIECEYDNHVGQYLEVSFAVKVPPAILSSIQEIDRFWVFNTARNRSSVNRCEGHVRWAFNSTDSQGFPSTYIHFQIANSTKILFVKMAHYIHDVNVFKEHNRVIIYSNCFENEQYVGFIKPLAQSISISPQEPFVPYKQYF